MSRSLQNVNLKIFRVACRHKHAENLPTKSVRMLTSLFKVFYFNCKGIKKIKNLQKISNKEIYFTLQNRNENLNIPFKFVSWMNHIDGNTALTPGDWSKIFTNWAKKCSDGYIFSVWYKLIHFSSPLIPALHRTGNTPNTLCPRCNETASLPLT